MAAGGSGWWDSWLQTAKEKSTSVLEFMKKDLDEFTTTVQHETSSIVNSTAATLRDKLNIEDNQSTASAVKRSVSGFLDTVSTAFTLPKEPNDDDEAFVIKNDEPVVLNRLELQLLLLQRDVKTYLAEPSGRPEDYDAWLADFNMSSKGKELSEILTSSSHLRSVYCRLVPADLSRSVFWHRYFYRVHQLLEAEKRRQALKQRADCPPGDDLELAWDEDDELNRHVLTPQETDRILDEYQRECEEQAQSEPDADQPLAEKQADLTLASSAAVLDRLAGASSVASSPAVPPTQLPTPPQPLAPASTLIEAPHAMDSQPESLRDELSRLDQCYSSEAPLRSGESETLPMTTAEPSPDSGADCDLPGSGESISGRDSQPSSKDESLNDDEWEKDFDIALTEDLSKPLTVPSTSEEPATQDEDWENWQ